MVQYDKSQFSVLGQSAEYVKKHYKIKNIVTLRTNILPFSTKVIQVLMDPSCCISRHIKLRYIQLKMYG